MTSIFLIVCRGGGIALVSTILSRETVHRNTFK
jgi:hypothetical protein